ncbi:MAG: hypothetical protein ACLUNV_06970 [Sutterella wadsworthensis]
MRLAPTPEGTAHLLQTLESRPLASLTDRERAFLASAFLSAPSNSAQAGKLDAVTLACTAPAAEKRHAESLAKGDGFVTLSAPGCTAFRLSSAASSRGSTTARPLRAGPPSPTRPRPTKDLKSSSASSTRRASPSRR